MKHDREFYINYFKEMEAKFIENELTNKQWIGVVLTMYEVIYEKQFFTRYQLAELFPILLKIK